MNATNLDDTILKHFMSTFYGSGNYKGDYWFIGMEEGGGLDLNQVTKRIDAWSELGQNELVDIYQFHLKIGFPEYFTNPVRLQKTWAQQARILLSSQGLQSSTEDVRIYQRDQIGRISGDTCLLELLPLPSPSLNTWNYNSWSSLPFLKDRNVYRDYCIPWRTKHLQLRIMQHKPKVVVFMGQVYSTYWQTIAGQHLDFVDIGGFQADNFAGTLYVITKHPAAYGVTNAYFEEIGDFISNFL
ncbi:MAG: hypothetical protein GX825_00440 [Syntrophomonadaceae bacterium]|nr:hypothetical protein [Syntrophomonadaceae bacterium]